VKVNARRRIVDTSSCTSPNGRKVATSSEWITWSKRGSMARVGNSDEQEAGDVAVPYHC
jgi:hypothetical protein